MLGLFRGVSSNFVRRTFLRTVQNLSLENLLKDLRPEDVLHQQATIAEVDSAKIGDVIRESDVPVVVLFHRASQDEDVVGMAESTAKIAGRLTLAKAKIDAEDVPTPTFVVAHGGRIVGRAAGRPCKDELLPFMLTVRALPGLSRTDPDFFVTAEFTGTPPPEFVAERPEDLSAAEQ